MLFFYYYFLSLLETKNKWEKSHLRMQKFEEILNRGKQEVRTENMRLPLPSQTTNTAAFPDTMKEPARWRQFCCSHGCERAKMKDYPSSSVWKLWNCLENLGNIEAENWLGSLQLMLSRNEDWFPTKLSEEQ